jgi:hypothetical protein
MYKTDKKRNEGFCRSTMNNGEKEREGRKKRREEEMDFIARGNERMIIQIGFEVEI